MQLNHKDIKAQGFTWHPLEYKVDFEGALYTGYYRYKAKHFNIDINYTEKISPDGKRDITYIVELLKDRDAITLPHIKDVEDLKQLKALLTGRYIRWQVDAPVSFPNRMINIFKNMVLPS